jgi:hypothetical protein
MIESTTAYGYPDCRIECNHDEESAEIHVEDGSVKLAACYDNDAIPMDGIAFEVNCKNPQGFVFLTYAQARELFKKFDETFENSRTGVELVVN